MPALARLALLALSAAIAGCGKSNAPGGGANPAEPGPVKVKVARANHQPLNWVVEQPGTVVPLEVTPLVAKIPGHVHSVAPDEAAVKAGVKLPRNQPPVIDIGSQVEAGQLLVTLAVPELDKELAEKAAAAEQAKAARVLAEKELAVADARIAAAKAGVQEAQAGTARAEADVVRWKAELDQVNTQITGGTADVQTRNVITKNYEAAKAAKAEAEARAVTAAAAVAEQAARKGRAEAEVAVAAAKVKATEAERERVAALLGYTRITSPFAGVVTDRGAVDLGRLVQPGSGPLFTVARVDVVRVFADIPEASAGRAGPGATAVVLVPALGREYPATVTRTTRVVNPESRTLRIEIDLENPDRLLLPGAYALVQVKAATPDAMVLPGACVMAADETVYAFLVEGGKAVKYRVQLGRTDGGVVQVLGRRKAAATAGPWIPFDGSEQVVNGNLGALADGTAVTVAE